MRTLSIALAAAVLCLPLAGCKKSLPASQPEMFSKDIDNPIRIPPLMSDPSLISGAGAAARTASAGGGAAVPGPAATGNAVADAKAALTSLVKALAGDTPEAAADFLVPEQAPLVRPLLAGEKKYALSLARLEKAITDKGIGGQYQAPAKKATELATLSDFSTKLRSLDPEKVKLEPAGADVKVTDPSAPTSGDLAFKNVSGRWLLSLPDLIQPGPGTPMFTAMAALLAAATSLNEALAQGIEGGTITGENFESQLQTLGKEKFEPAATQFTKAMQDAAGMPASAPAVEATPSPAPAPAATPSAAPAPSPGPGRGSSAPPPIDVPDPALAPGALIGL